MDVKDYYADSILIKNKIRAWFGKEFAKDKTKYVVIFSKVKKCDSEGFVKSMEELNRKMLLLGYDDYEDVCKQLFSK